MKTTIKLGASKSLNVKVDSMPQTIKTRLNNLTVRPSPVVGFVELNISTIGSLHIAGMVMNAEQTRELIFALEQSLHAMRVGA